MEKTLDQSRFGKVLTVATDEDRGEEYLSYVEEQIRHDTWQHFHDDVFAIPATARRLYLPLCFDIGVRGDGLGTALAFYAYQGDALVTEISEGFKLVGLPGVEEIIWRSLEYWRDPQSPMHSDSVPWMRMDIDLDGVHGKYYKMSEDLCSAVGGIITELGEAGVHENDTTPNEPNG